MRTPTEERELLVSGYTYDRDGTRAGTLDVYTSDYSYMLKFDRFCKENPEEWQAGEVMTCGGGVVGKKYRVAIGCIFFRGKTFKRILTEEQRQALAERGKENIKRLHSNPDS